MTLEKASLHSRQQRRLAGLVIAGNHVGTVSCGPVISACRRLAEVLDLNIAEFSLPSSIDRFQIHSLKCHIRINPIWVSGVVPQGAEAIDNTGEESISTQIIEVILVGNWYEAVRRQPEDVYSGFQVSQSFTNAYTLAETDRTGHRQSREQGSLVFVSCDRAACN